MTIGVYEIRNTANGRRYIGSSVNCERRIRDHKSYLKSGTHQNVFIQRDYDKHGCEKFVYSIIEVCDKDNVIAREQHHVDAGCDYNIKKECVTTMKGFRHSEESKRKISEGMKVTMNRPDVKARLRAANVGKTLSDEHKKKISESHKRFWARKMAA